MKSMKDMKEMRKNWEAFGRALEPLDGYRSRLRT
jgi:hypothetical protein